eukprot:3110637-Rhodomonas_salina.2
MLLPGTDAGTVVDGKVAMPPCVKLSAGPLHLLLRAMHVCNVSSALGLYIHARSQGLSSYACVP